MKKIPLLCFLVLLLSLSLTTASVFSQSTSAVELLAAVNDARLNLGLEMLEEANALNIAAQNQADYLGSTYGSDFFGVMNWHDQPDGTNEYNRAVAAGYTIVSGRGVDEIAYGGNDESDVYDAISWWRNSGVHNNVMMSADNVHIGAGISEGDGYRYYVVVFGVDYGSGGSAGSGVASTVPTTAVTPKVAPVSVASANEDGSVFHEVEKGQALWSIALAYEITIDQILALNGLDANAVIYEGQTLQVKAAYTPTPEPTATETPLPPTRTPVPAQTARAVVTQVPIPQEESGGLRMFDKQSFGLVLILISGIGLVLIVVGTIAKDRESKKSE